MGRLLWANVTIYLPGKVPLRWRESEPGGLGNN